MSTDPLSLMKQFDDEHGSAWRAPPDFARQDAARKAGTTLRTVIAQMFVEAQRYESDPVFDLPVDRLDFGYASLELVDEFNLRPNGSFAGLWTADYRRRHVVPGLACYLIETIARQPNWRWGMDYKARFASQVMQPDGGRHRFFPFAYVESVVESGFRLAEFYRLFRANTYRREATFGSIPKVFPQILVYRDALDDGLG